MTSSLSWTVISIGVPHLISPPPASRNILATTPSSCASKSTVALSVSIEHMTSLALKYEPTSTF